MDHPVNSDQKTQAILNFVRWQVGSRSLKSAVAVDFVNNSRLLVKTGMAGATGNIYTGLHEFGDMAFFIALFTV